MPLHVQIFKLDPSGQVIFSTTCIDMGVDPHGGSLTFLRQPFPPFPSVYRGLSLGLHLGSLCFSTTNIVQPLREREGSGDFMFFYFSEGAGTHMDGCVFFWLSFFFFVQCPQCVFKPFRAVAQH